MHIPNHIDTDPSSMTFSGSGGGTSPAHSNPLPAAPSTPYSAAYGQTLGANWGGNMGGLQSAWNNQFGNTAGTNPTNPNPYDFNWSSSTINPYLQGANVNNPTGMDQIQWLASQGIDVTGLSDEELAFLPSMDRINTAWNRMNTNVGMARTGLGFGMDASQLAGTQNLLGMTGGQGLSSVGGGFGKTAANMFSNLRSQGQQYRTDLNQQLAGFQSDVLGMRYDFEDAESNYQDSLTTALGNIMASGETDLAVSATAGPFNPPQGASIGTNYQWGSHTYTLAADGQWKRLGGEGGVAGAQEDAFGANNPADAGFNAASGIDPSNPLQGVLTPNTTTDAQGNTTTTTYSWFSDNRLKKDINYLFTMNNKVPIYSFKYKGYNETHIGTMAQDIEDMIPDAVSEVNGYKMVDYEKVFNFKGGQ